MSDERTLSTSRILPYTPKEIFAAFESADLLASWWGPEGFSNTFEVFEFSQGGVWKFTMHGPDGTDYSNESIFEDIVPEAKIVIRHVCPPHFKLTIELKADSEGTLLTWSQVFDDAEMARAIKHRAGSAIEENLDKLTQVLSKLSG